MSADPLWMLAPLLLIFVVLSLIKTALRSLSRVAVRRLAEAQSGRRRAGLEEYLENPAELVLRLQTLIQLSLVVMVVLLAAWWLGTGVDLRTVTATMVAVGIVLVLEQFFPRYVASVNRERLLTSLLPMFLLLAPLSRIIAWPVGRTFQSFLRPLESGRGNGIVSDEDVRAFIDVGEREGILDAGEGELIESVVDFGDTVVREVMTPRVDMIGVESGRTVAQVRNLIMKEHHSRLPVYRERVDNIEGVVDVRHLLKAWRDGKEADKVVSWMKPVRFVPETKPVAGLLREFQRDRVTFAIVVDEYGGISGLVTIEDLVEEIVGDIAEEHEAASEPVVRQPDGSYLISAKEDVETLEELFGLEIDEVGYDTVGGLVFATLGRVPAVGEEFSLDGLRVRIVEADQRRVSSVRVASVRARPSVEAEPGGPAA